MSPLLTTVMQLWRNVHMRSSRAAHRKPRCTQVYNEKHCALRAVLMKCALSYKVPLMLRTQGTKCIKLLSVFSRCATDLWNTYDCLRASSPHTSSWNWTPRARAVWPSPRLTEWLSANFHLLGLCVKRQNLVSFWGERKKRKRRSFISLTDAVSLEARRSRRCQEVHLLRGAGVHRGPENQFGP